MVIKMKFFLFGLAVFSFLLAGCGGGGGGDDGGGETVQQASSNGLPPDPGEAGKATLEGIDSDGDGVRDDVQRYISSTYKDNEKAQKIITQFAKIKQSFLLNTDMEKQTENAKLKGLNIGCIYYYWRDEANDMLKDLKMEFLNTKERVIANIKASSLLGGESFELVTGEALKNSCEDMVK